MSCCDICDELAEVRAEQAWQREALTLLLLHAGLQVPGAAPATSEYWNPSDKSSDITLSNSDKTATAPGTFPDTRGVRSVTSHSSGKYYFEILCGQVDTTFIGVSTSSFDYDANPLGLDSDGCGYQSDNGDVYYGGPFPPSAELATYTAADVIGVAVDIDAGKVWFAKNNDFQGGDPAAGSGEHVTSLAAGTYFATSSLFEPSDEITLRTADSDFSYTPPTGFSAWG